MINIKFFACSVGAPGEDYVEDNFQRIIKDKAFVLHQDTNQPGVYSNIRPGDILLLKYNNQFIAYGKTTGILKSDHKEWNLRAPVIDWISKNPENPKEGVTTSGIGYETLGGGQYGTVKELTPKFGLMKMKELNSKSQTYIEIITEIQIQKKMENIQNQINLLKFKKQIILQGPPGTGKTFTAKDIAEKVIFGSVSEDKTEQKRKLEESEQFQLVQFHPSYSYEDFVRGITAKSNDGKIEYDTEDKIFAKMAEKAMLLKPPFEKQYIEKWVNKYWEDIENKFEETNSECNLYFNKNSIDKKELNFNARIFGDWRENITVTKERLSSLALVGFTFKSALNREGIKYNDLHIFDSFSRYFEFYRPKSIILVIDEINRANLPSVLGELIYALEYRGEKVESMYAKDGDASIVIPENLYIIGTMNTADRSVGHIDYAIRRRFAFVDILPSSEIIDNVISDPAIKGKALKLYAEVSNLFYEKKDEKDISPIFLAADFKAHEVQLGHSYFLTKTEEQLKLKLEYEIKPILNEYVKDGILLDSAREVIKNLQIQDA